MEYYCYNLTSLSFRQKVISLESSRLIVVINQALIKGRKIPISHSLTQRAFFSFNLDRGMKLLITSPGLKKNWTKLKKDVDLDIFSSDHLFVPSAELVNEIFYQIKREVGDDFLRTRLISTFAGGG
jgi:hypothetical protein